MGDFQIRTYQQALIDEILAHIYQDNSSIGMSLPTGGGKTIVAARLCIELIRLGYHPVFITDRIVLASQTVSKFKEHGIEGQLLQGSNTKLLSDCDCSIGTIQTISNYCERAEEGRDVNPFIGFSNLFFIVDEFHIIHKAHLYLFGKYPDAPRLGMSATPERKGLGNTFKTFVQGPSTQELINDNYLVPFKCFGPSEPDLAKIKLVATSLGMDYDTTELGKRMTLLVGDMVKSWLELAKGLKTIIFATNVAHAHALEDHFLKEGINACSISYKTEDEDRQAMYEAFKKGDLDIMISVNILSLGFDEPSVKCVMLARPTKSLILHIQQCGRGARLFAGKSVCLIIDHCGNIANLGFPQDYVVNGLDTGDLDHDNSQEKQERLAKACTECGFLKQPEVVECPNCGHRARTQSNVSYVDTDLVNMESQVLVHTSQVRQEFYQELLWYVKTETIPPMSKKPMTTRAAAGTFKARYGVWPPWDWNLEQPIRVSALTVNEIKRQRLAFFASLKKAS